MPLVVHLSHDFREVIFGPRHPLGHRGREAVEEAQVVNVRVRRVCGLKDELDLGRERGAVLVEPVQVSLAGVWPRVVHLDCDLFCPRHFRDARGYHVLPHHLFKKRGVDVNVDVDWNTCGTVLRFALGDAGNRATPHAKASVKFVRAVWPGNGAHEHHLRDV